MIQLTRVRNSLIPAGLRGEARLTKNRELITQHLAGGAFQFKPGYWKPGKRQLRAESAGKCSYCEGPTEVVAHGDVEHFRPKKVYWWLAYCYDNHLFACQICNQVHKSDRFPVFGIRMRPPRLPKRNPAAAASHFGPDPLDDSVGQSRAMIKSSLVSNMFMLKLMKTQPTDSSPRMFG